MRLLKEEHDFRLHPWIGPYGPVLGRVSRQLQMSAVPGDSSQLWGHTWRGRVTTKEYLEKKVEELETTS